MNQRDYKIKLFKKFIRVTDFIQETDYKILEEIANKYKDNIPALSKCYDDFLTENPLAEKDDLKLHYKQIGTFYFFSYKEESTAYNKEQFKKILLSMIALLEDILPLGSVVALKKMKPKSPPLIVVITYRFLAKKKDTHYFPYAGVIYPVGMLGNDEVLYFSQNMIEEIIHRGYEDEQEDNYVYLMKKEMIVEKNMTSYGYDPKEVLETFQNS